MQLVVIAHNIRSTYNVGSIFRTCNGFGVSKLYLSGYTPYPATANDMRLPHLRNKLTGQIHKTALGAEASLPFEFVEHPATIITTSRQEGFTVAALEQTDGAALLANFKPSAQKVVLLLGEEVHGITPDLLALCDVALEIPMLGQKESFNVSVAAGIALYALTCQK